MILGKMVYSFSIFKLSYLTRKGLTASLNMSAYVSVNKRAMYRRLFLFTLLPLFLNVLFLGHEVLYFLRRFHFKHGEKLCQESGILQLSVVQGLRAVVFTFGSFCYLIAYLMLFPKVRAAFSFRHSENDTNELETGNG